LPSKGTSYWVKNRERWACRGPPAHTATHCNTLQHTATHCNTLQHPATRAFRGPPAHTATHCNTLQHAATHCNTQQYTAIPCNTLQHAEKFAIKETCERDMQVDNEGRRVVGRDRKRERRGWGGEDVCVCVVTICVGRTIYYQTFRCAAYFVRICVV